MKKFLVLLAMFLTFTTSMMANEVVKVGIAANYPPFDYMKNGKLTGFDYDLLTAVAKKAGLTLQWQNMSFSALIPALKTGKIDMIISAMSNTAKRARSVDFSNTYFLTKNLYLKNKGDESLKDLASLQGKKLGVQLGSIQEARAKKLKGVILVPSENIINSIMALKAKKIAAVLADKDTAQGYLDTNKGSLVAFFQENDGSKGFAMAFDKNKQAKLIAKINEALSELKKSGEYKKLEEKYKLN